MLELLGKKRNKAKKCKSGVGVQKNEKRKNIYDLFTYMAPIYDLMNDVFSLGLHRIWKNTLISHLAPAENMKVIDMAGGTGSLSFRILNYVKKRKIKDFHMTVCDINEDMLEEGRKRNKFLKFDSSSITWVKDDAENLLFEDGHFDAYVISFGVRNCVDKEKVLKEAHRILRPGGKFLCLEFSHVENKVIRWFYDLYAYCVLPLLGYILFRNNQVYEYLIKGVEEFPDQKTFQKMIEEAGFKNAKFENLLFGTVAIHSGLKY